MQVFDIHGACDFLPTYLFSEEIEANPWVGYHATSSCCEEGIERFGLAGSLLISGEQVYRLRRIFVSMNWQGMHQGGYGVLMAFSSVRSIGLQTPPIHLGSFPKRCLLYATPDFVGGETLRPVGYAVADLERFIQDARLRQEHLGSQIGFSRAHFELTGQRLRVIDVDLNWLDEQLALFRALARMRRDLEMSYRWGTIYAIRFGSDELRNLEDGGSESIRYFGDLTPNHIIAKVRIRELQSKAALEFANAAKLGWIRSGRFHRDLCGLISTNNERSVHSLNMAIALIECLRFTEAELDMGAGKNIADAVF
jgi:hypothetical protein